MSLSSEFPEGTDCSQGSNLAGRDWEEIFPLEREGFLREPCSPLRFLALVLPSSEVYFPFGKCCQRPFWEKNGFVLLACGRTAFLISRMLCAHESTRSLWHTPAKAELGMLSWDKEKVKNWGHKPCWGWLLLTLLARESSVAQSCGQGQGCRGREEELSTASPGAGAPVLK